MANGITDTARERYRRPAETRSVRIGELTITYLPDGAVGLDARGWLPHSSDADWAAHPEHLDERGQLVASIGGLLVEADERALLIDAGIGRVEAGPVAGTPVGGATGGALLDSLAAIGRDPASIEAVAFTHLHSDHVGWAGVADTFPGAKFLVDQREWAERELAERAGTPREALDTLATSLRGIEAGEEVFPGVRALPSPGHTVGHTGFVIASGGRRLIAFGDALHTAAQVDRPDWHAWPDYDPRQAVESRRRLIAELAKPDTLGFGVHFADVQFGEVHPADDRPAWRPIAG
ncbi:MBL fold metallo-hydrolase [Pseudonocardia eucalypti]|uniref:MBL fold metallo-hydrolase n=1 Tax=Pseudonocardia eucalypti TaxID=648755 RepID=A0ABP9RCS6_9PSEU|nr:glyoxylase-like metal-dependent hydrolase (beta-lactamase superfamily II) [Pseudonocardia eucalypti]